MPKTTVANLHERLMSALDVQDIQIPVSYVKLYHDDDEIPSPVAEYEVSEETVMCCQASRHAAQGHAVLLTRRNIGCVAAAITLGLVDQNQPHPMNPEARVYTDIMKEQSGLRNGFTPPCPRDFTDGSVYACKAAGKPEYALFGADDSGRFKDMETARRAVQAMMVIQPPTTKAVFIFGNEFSDCDLIPDVVVLSLRPVELARLIQGYQYITGKRVKADMGPLRAVDSDLIVRPYLTGEINVATYCLGARLVARFEADRLGMGVPFGEYVKLVQGVEESRTGFPFPRYPGAAG